MASVKLKGTSLRAGVWEGVLTAGQGMPQLEISHLGQPVAGLRVTPDAEQAGQFIARLAIPAELLNDGVQSFVVSDGVTGEVLDRFSIVMGHPLDHDLRVEIDLIRAELDMLKRAFRRHCSEGECSEGE